MHNAACYVLIIQLFPVFGQVERKHAREDKRIILSWNCQVPESLHTKIKVNKGESVTDGPRRTDWESDSPDSHEAALDCKS
jgi:hypothetical protein